MFAFRRLTVFRGKNKHSGSNRVAVTCFRARVLRPHPSSLSVLPYSVCTLLAMAKLTLEEEEMMKQLLEGLDDTLSDYVPTPAKPKAQTQSKTPKRSPLLQKPKKSSQSPLVSKKARGKENARQQAVFSKKEIDSLMEGVDDMDWDDMLLDLSKPPPQPKLIPKPAPPAPPRFPEKVVYSAGTSKSKYTPDPCTRCIVTSVEEKSLPNYRQEKVCLIRILKRTNLDLFGSTWWFAWIADQNQLKVHKCKLFYKTTGS